MGHSITTVSTQGLYGTVTDRIVAISTQGLYDELSAISTSVGAWLMPAIRESDEFRYGRRQVTTNAAPLTEITTSSVQTTYSPKYVVDAVGWDLSAVQVNHIAGNSEGWVGKISNTGTNTVYVDFWRNSPQKINTGQAWNVPGNGVRVSVFSVLAAKQITLYADPANDGSVYLGFSSGVTAANGFPISHTAVNPNAGLILSAPKKRWLNLGQFWVVAESTQNIRWIIT